MKYLFFAAYLVESFIKLQTYSKHNVKKEKATCVMLHINVNKEMLHINNVCEEKDLNKLSIDRFEGYYSIFIGIKRNLHFYFNKNYRNSSSEGQTSQTVFHKKTVTPV